MSFYEEYPEYEFAENADGSCIVCGAPNGSCKGESASLDQIRFIPKVSLNDPFATFIVPERIYEESFNGKKIVKKLIYPKGAKIRVDEAKRLGLIP